MIPEFDGNLNNWEDFRDIFIAVVDNDEKMPLIKKMHYLKGCLKDEATGIISRIEISAEGYETWALIVKRFDNPQRRLESDLHGLFEAKPFTEASAKGINALMDSVEQLTRLLNKLENFRDCIYLYALKRRLDKETKRHWERSLSHTEIPKYEDLRKFLTHWVISLENETVRVEQTSGSRATNSKSKLKGNKSRERKELSVNATNITKDVRCSMCKEDYALVKCRKFQELPSWRRREQV